MGTLIISGAEAQGIIGAPINDGPARAQVSAEATREYGKWRSSQLLATGSIAVLSLAAGTVFVRRRGRRAIPIALLICLVPSGLVYLGLVAFYNFFHQ